MTSDFKFADRLSDVKDQHFFAGIFFLGICIMGLGRGVLDMHSGLVSILLVLLLGLYALAITLTKRYHLREDKSADNLYFLGFLFTVSALIVSLIKFSQDTGGDSLENSPLIVVEDLAIGLITTLVGLFLRVLFTQLRRDPVEIEEEVNLQLTMVAERVARNLRGVSELVERSAMAMDQVLTESRAQIEEQQTLTKELFDSARKDIGSANTSVAKGINRLEERINSIEIRQDLVSSKLQPALEEGERIVREFSNKVSNIELPPDLFKNQAARAIPENLFSDGVQRALPPTIFSERLIPIFDSLDQLLEQRLNELSQSTKERLEASLTAITNEITVLIGDMEAPSSLIVDGLEPMIMRLQLQLGDLIQGFAANVEQTRVVADGGNVELASRVEAASERVKEFESSMAEMVVFFQGIDLQSTFGDRFVEIDSMMKKMELANEALDQLKANAEKVNEGYSSEDRNTRSGS